MSGDREEIEQAILLAGPIYDDAAAIDAIEHIIRKRAAAELRAAAKWALLEAASHEGYAAKGMSRNSDLRAAEARVFRAARNRLNARATELDES